MRRCLGFCVALLIISQIYPIPSAYADDRCITAPVLMYHHVAPMTEKWQKKYASLFVEPAMFRRQMQELKEKGYEIRPLRDLKNFFDYGAPLPKKTAFITFDDGNKNIYEKAAPILKEFGYPSTMFVVIHQMSHPLYFSIEEARELAGQQVHVASHTQTHKRLDKQKNDVVMEEIGKADQTLKESRLNFPKILAYPYGATSPSVQEIASNYGYSLAFIASPGKQLCASNRLTLPRVQVLSKPLSEQGF